MLTYPTPLHGHVAHSARLSEALREITARTSEEERAFLWLVGRAGEVQAFVADVVREWSHGWVDAQEAAGVIDRYLRDLHESFRRRVDRALDLPCCRASSGGSRRAQCDRIVRTCGSGR
jgi:hypothetical protein